MWRDGPVDLVPIAPDDERLLRGWHAVESAALAHDHPDEPPLPWSAVRSRLAVPWPGTVARAWAAMDSGTVLGVGRLEIFVRDNLDAAHADVVVDPVARRRGIGRELLAMLTADVRAAGRTRLLADARSPLDGGSPGTAFAEAAGAVDAQLGVQRCMDPRTTTPPPVPGREWPLVDWSGETPAEWVDDVARLAGRMATDSPQGDLDREPEVHDADRVREHDAMCRARGITLLTTAAVAPDGRLAGYSEIAVTEVEWAAHTWNTLVLPEHRGHALGLRIKIAGLALLRRHRPAVRRLTTWNAASNRHMIAINERLGFRPSGAAHEYRLDL
jgi:GNAT superfamily N-acetyltransferase